MSGLEFTASLRSGAVIATGEVTGIQAVRFFRGPRLPDRIRQHIRERAWELAEDTVMEQEWASDERASRSMGCYDNPHGIPEHRSV